MFNIYFVRVMNVPSRIFCFRISYKTQKSKITAVPTAWFFWRHYRLVVGNISIVLPQELADAQL